MKRNILLGLVTALILAVSASTLLIGEPKKDKKEKAEKVLVCHIPNDNPGFVISVAAAAVAAHLAHGDCLMFSTGGSGGGRDEEHLDEAPGVGVGDPCGCRGDTR